MTHPSGSPLGVTREISLGSGPPPAGRRRLGSLNETGAFPVVVARVLRSHSYRGETATMRTTATAVVTVALLTWAGSGQAQTIDAGRGALPVTVPAGYTGDVAAPLIVLLHTYGNTGAGQDQYMGLSALAAFCSLGLMQRMKCELVRRNVVMSASSCSLRGPSYSISSSPTM